MPKLRETDLTDHEFFLSAGGIGPPLPFFCRAIRYH